ncbi:DUF4145 domain-containing protein [Bradyrhizobium sp. CB3481]|uniref:DUF4145 domain-containing protein n=1 Tax=Bradyrhizobium sp. CB3481 TaxID=3039158 RepID=UPI0024B15A1C|nr:DUF4145 domain-containing protein [Bradyrhizobium sp. CB3481]WFU14412.1 DUF4145 domain-containing protein [Bradyrhizobium sp. CB3481]
MKKAFCSDCKGERNCNVHGEYIDYASDENVWERKEWLLLQCCGCEHVFVRTVGTFSEDYSYGVDDRTGETELIYDETTEFWPATAKRPRPQWFPAYCFEDEKLEGLHGVMTELYGALDHDLLRLAAAGVRTAFDLASEALGVHTALTFKQKLDALVDAGKINNLDKDRLETLTDAASASLHRGWAPAPSDISTMVDILKHFVHRWFIQPAIDQKLSERSAVLKRTVPPKLPRPKS